MTLASESDRAGGTDRGASQVGPAATNTFLVDSLGCPLSRLSTDQKMSEAGITLYHKRSMKLELGQVSTTASDRGFLIGISNQPGHRRRILRPRGADHYDFDCNSIYIRDFGDDYKADISGSFDFLLMEFAPTLLGRVAGDAGRNVMETPICDPGRVDIVLGNLARAMFATSIEASASSQLFMDQMATVIGMHIVDRYCSSNARPTRVQGLSRAQEKTAKEVLLSKLDGKVSIDEIATACGLSRGHFTRAFRTTTGQSPHRWQISQRLELARELMRDQKIPLAEIAIACGFSDQSHFTRIFSQRVGTSPGNWRRSQV